MQPLDEQQRPLIGVEEGEGGVQETEPGELPGIDKSFVTHEITTVVAIPTPPTLQTLVNRAKQALGDRSERKFPVEGQTAVWITKSDKVIQVTVAEGDSPPHVVAKVGIYETSGQWFVHGRDVSNVVYCDSVGKKRRWGLYRGFTNSTLMSGEAREGAWNDACSQFQNMLNLLEGVISTSSDTT